MMKLTRTDLLLSKSLEKLKYGSREREYKLATHWGQLKLLLSELYFFVTVCGLRPEDVRDVVYVGAAAGFHIVTMTKLFPKLNFHLYDPATFCPKLEKIAEEPGSRVHIHNVPFEDDLARGWKGKEGVLFVCDMRTLGPKTADEEAEAEMRASNVYDAKAAKKFSAEKVEAAVKRDMLAQEEWVRIIKPDFAFLKFRLPYILSAETERTFEYLDGDVYIQQFAGPSSTETRLVVRKSDGFATKLWNAEDYEQRLFYHNAVRREVFEYESPLKNLPWSFPFKSTFDDAAAVLIISEYLTAWGVEPSAASVAGVYDELAQDTGSSLAKRREEWLAKFKQITNPVYLRTGDRVIGRTTPVCFPPWHATSTPTKKYVPPHVRRKWTQQ